MVWILGCIAALTVLGMAAAVASKSNANGATSVVALLSRTPSGVEIADLPCEYHLGKVLGDDRPFFLSDEMLTTHMCVLGRTGSGKSKMLELWMREMLVANRDGSSEARRGFCLIDPNGDLSEDALAYVGYLKASGDDETWRRVHYIEPSYEQVFSYDPFTFRPPSDLPPERSEAAYRAWLHTKCDRVGEILQRKQGQSGTFEGMPRLQRVLRNLLLAVGTAVHDNGKHLPLADALVLLDVFHERHAEVYARVEPHLDSEVRSDFDRWHGAKYADQVLKETDSTLNRIRSFLGPVVRAIFCEQVQTIDFRRIIQNGEILLVNLRETNYFSADAAKSIGSLFIHEVLTNVASEERSRRTPYVLIIDEAPDFIGADIDRALRQCRKYLLTVCLAGQDATSFRKGPELDLTNVILTQPGVLVSFEQRGEEDLRLIVPTIFRGNLDCETELYQVMDRPCDPAFLSMKEYTEQFTWAENWTNGFALTNTATTNETITENMTQQTNWAHQKSRGSARGETNTKATTANRSETEGKGQSPIVKDFLPHGMIDTRSGSVMKGEAHQQGRGESFTLNESESDTNGGASSRGLAVARGGAEANSQAVNVGKGGQQGGGMSISHKTILVPQTWEDWQPAGRLRSPIAEQIEWYKQRVDQLGKRQAAVRVPGRKGVFVEIGWVSEKWSLEEKFEVIVRMKQRLFALHPYYTVPRVGPAEENRRLDAYLAGTKATGNTLPRLTAGQDAVNEERDDEDPIEHQENPFGH